MTSRALIEEGLQDARVAAFAPHEFVGQESFMSASEILTVARAASLGPGKQMLDICCGTGGPGRFLTQACGCGCVGVDGSADAVALARTRAIDAACRYVIAAVPPLPAGPYDVVLLLETFLAFRDKQAVITAVADILHPGGRFAFTLEEGSVLTTAEHAAMPQSDTVWPVPLPELQSLLTQAGFVIRWSRDDSRSQLGTVERLLDAYTTNRARIAAALGEHFIDDLVTSHRLWRDWIRTGRIRKFALVAEKL